MIGENCPGGVCATGGATNDAESAYPTPPPVAEGCPWNAAPAHCKRHHKHPVPRTAKTLFHLRRERDKARALGVFVIAPTPEMALEEVRLAYPRGEYELKIIKIYALQDSESVGVVDCF